MIEPEAVADDVTLRPVDPDADAPTIHSWVDRERARFWGMAGMSVDQVAEIYGYIDEQDHLAAYVFEIAVAGGDVEGARHAVGILQTYDPFVDEIGEFYERREGDLGVHLLLDDDPARRGRTSALLAAGFAFLLEQPGMKRLVLEPDARNEASLALLERLGAERGPLVDLRTSVSEKPAQFFFLDAADVRRLAARAWSGVARVEQ